MTPITQIAPHQVFVFGSNLDGFHGAGSAGQACRGDPRNNWREDEWFLKALRSPAGSPDRIGKWAVFGQAKGWQRGTEGMSYAIVTVTRPGQRRSIPLDDIKAQLVELCAFCCEHPEWEFLMTPIGAGYAGYSESEMQWYLERAFEAAGGQPDNLTVPLDLYGDVSVAAT